MTEAGVLSPDDQTELIEGEIIDMAPIGSRHAEVVRLHNKRLVQAIGDAADVSSQLPVRLSLRSEPQPDFAILKPGARTYRDAHPVAENVLLLIEISDSTLRYDLETKARLYATHGIPEYWVVDLLGHRVWRHRGPSGQQYVQCDEITEGVLKLPELRGEIAVAGLF
jgi:Uma2 family endonuclease